MSNPNAPINKLKKHLKERWQGPDYPNGQRRFQVALFIKDFAIFVLLPIFTVVLFKSCESAVVPTNKKTTNKKTSEAGLEFMESRSQIIDFRSGASSKSPYLRKAPGALVKVKLLNNVETYSTAPVHAQIIDNSLGRSLYGGTLVGEAVPDNNIDRINITFQFVKDPKRGNVAVPISARSLSMDGTFGIVAHKKGNVFARSALASLPSIGQSFADKDQSKNIFLKALSSGFMNEGEPDLQVHRNRLQVLKLDPNTEFYAELTDYFPGSAR